MNTINEYIKEFNYYLSVEKNYSKKTLKTYNNNLKGFKEYFEKILGKVNFPLVEVNKDLLKNYLMHIKIDSSNKASTINNKISTLKSYYSFLVDKNYITIIENITLGLKLQKLPKTLPIYLSYEEAENLLLGTKLLSNNACRDYALLCMFLLTGARLSEITNLTIDHVNFTEKNITLLGKGSKERTVPLVERAEIALKEYLNNDKCYIEKHNNKGKFLVEDKTLKGRFATINTKIIFLNKYGRPLSERGIQDIIMNLLIKTGIYRKGLSVHKLRHTCFTLLHKSGVDILRIKRIAGHENIKTTEIYTHLNDKDLLISMQMNPLNSNNYDNTFIRLIKERYNNK